MILDSGLLFWATLYTGFSVVIFCLSFWRNFYDRTRVFREEECRVGLEISITKAAQNVTTADIQTHKNAKKKKTEHTFCDVTLARRVTGP